MNEMEWDLGYNGNMEHDPLNKTGPDNGLNNIDQHSVLIYTVKGCAIATYVLTSYKIIPDTFYLPLIHT